jgi:hypothetical protein
LFWGSLYLLFPSNKNYGNYFAVPLKKSQAGLPTEKVILTGNLLSLNSCNRTTYDSLREKTQHDKKINREEGNSKLFLGAN